MRMCSKLIACTLIAMLCGCATIPQFQDKLIGEKPAAPRLSDITMQVQCEILTALDAGRKYNKRMNDAKKNGTVDDDKTGSEFSDLDGPNWVANVNLTLDVTDDEGINPSLSYVSHALSLSPPTNLSASLSGQFSEEQHRNITVAFTLLFSHATPLDSKCQTRKSGGSELSGNLGIGEMLSTGMPYAIGATTYPYLMPAVGVGIGTGLTDPVNGAPALVPSFGSTVDFSIVYGLGGSPTWSLEHFTFPSPSSGSLVTAMRTHKDTLILSFAQVTPNQGSNPAAIKGAGQAAVDNTNRMILQRFLTR